MIVETADYDYEQRLVDRLTLKEIIRALPYRQKDVILRRHIHGETLDEVGERHDVSRERIRQIERKALGCLQEYALRRGRPLPHPEPPPPPKPAKPVVQKPPEDKRAIFQRELSSLHFAIKETVALSQPPPSPVRYEPPPPPPRPALPTTWAMEALAAEAHKQLLNIRRPLYLGIPWLGPMCSGVRYPRIGGVLLSAIEALANEIPHHARLSAHKLEVPPGTLGANWTTPEMSLRATCDANGDLIFIHATWDN